MKWSTEFDSLTIDETTANVPTGILRNEIDRHEAVSEERLWEMFGSYDQTTGKRSVSQKELNVQFLPVFVCTVLKRQGYREGSHRMACTLIKH